MISEKCFVEIKGNVMYFAKSINPSWPAQSAQADLGRNFLLLVNCLRVEGPVYIII